MAYIALPAARRELPNFGVLLVIVLALAWAVIAVRTPEAIATQYPTTPIALFGP
jgi:hypothetical protein